MFRFDEQKSGPVRIIDHRLLSQGKEWKQPQPRKKFRKRNRDRERKKCFISDSYFFFPTVRGHFEQTEHIDSHKTNLMNSGGWTE